jgi:hypothetical protein
MFSPTTCVFSISSTTRPTLLTSRLPRITARPRPPILAYSDFLSWIPTLRSPPRPQVSFCHPARPRGRYPKLPRSKRTRAATQLSKEVVTPSRHRVTNAIWLPPPTLPGITVGDHQRRPAPSTTPTC